MKDIFRKLANKISIWTGSATSFLIAFSIIFVWGVTGPAFKYSSNWQLVINTGTTIVTFLMVFLIQNTQNRDGKALQLKLDELIRSSKPARDNFLDLEDMSDQELKDLDDEFRLIHDKYKNAAPAGIHKLHKKIDEVRSSRRK